MADAMELLEQHHGDADTFVTAMKQSASNRFDEKFWQLWQQWIQPNLKDDAVVCDFGCGPAAFFQQLHQRQPAAKLIGVECMPYMIREIDTQLCDVVQHDLNKPDLAIANNSVDTFLTSFVLHEMVQPIYALQNMHRTLKAGQRGLILDWVRAPFATYLNTYLGDEANQFMADESWSEDKLVDTFNHFTEHSRYTIDDVVWLLEKAGFIVLEHKLADNPNFAHWVVEKP